MLFSALQIAFQLLRREGVKTLVYLAGIEGVMYVVVAYVPYYNMATIRRKWYLCARRAALRSPP